MKPFRVYFSCDIDPDQATMSTADRTNITWHGVNKLVDIFNIFNEHELRLTLFIRADDQIRLNFSESTYWIEKLSEKFAPEFNDHELAWHPHLYRMDANEYHPIQSAVEAIDQLAKTLVEIRRNGFNPTTVRLGEAWHSTEIMSFLDTLGFTVDSSAVPGMKRADVFRSIDWGKTPNGPYHPSPYDYRIADTKKLRILEMPMTTAEIFTIYDKIPRRRYLNLTYHPQIFSSAFDSALAELSLNNIHDMVLIFHPGEILDVKPNDLHQYGFITLRTNIIYLLDKFKKLSMPVQFLTLCEAPQYVE